MTYMSAFIIRRHDLNVVICSLDPHDSVHIELYTLRTNVARSEIGWSEEGIHTPEPVGLRPSGAWIPSLRFFDRSSLVKKKVSSMPLGSLVIRLAPFGYLFA